jgi:hypothetical protein
MNVALAWTDPLDAAGGLRFAAFDAHEKAAANTGQASLAIFTITIRESEDGVPIVMNPTIRSRTWE